MYAVLKVLQFNEIPDDYVTAIELDYHSISHPLDVFGDEIADPGNRVIIIATYMYVQCTCTCTVHVSIDTIVILLHIFF